jgi:hypothetical protein
MTGLYLAVFLLGGFSAGIRAGEGGEAEYLSDTLSDRIESVSQGWGEFGLNESASTTPGKAPKLRIGDKEYGHGLGHHANGEIVVELGGQFKTFQTEIGIQWQGGNAPASVIFRVFVDNKQVFESEVVRENDPPKSVTVPVEGANELRLVANDAGDGIGYDCVVWGDARLARNPSAAKEPKDKAVDIAPFAYVSTWDPSATSGTKASRVEEMPAEDVRTAKELLPSENGNYIVPIEKNTGCIGLRWDEYRMLRRLELQFPDAAVPAAASVRLQWWNGESAWQGAWQDVDVAPQKVEDRLVWKLGFRALPKGTQKVRWLIAEAKPGLSVKGLSAFTRSRWNTVDVQLQAVELPASKKVESEIELYNGIFEGQSGKAAHRLTWDMSKPLTLKVRSSTAHPYKADRTVLRVNTGTRAFGVAVEDLQANDCVYVPIANLFATRLPAPITLDAYLKKIAGQKTMLDRVRQQADQDFTRAWKVVHHAVQDIMPTLLSLACDNRKYVVDRGGAMHFNEYDSPFDPYRAPTDTIYSISFKTPWHCTPIFGGGNNLKIARGLKGGWLPIVATTAVEGAMNYEQSTYVSPLSEAGGPSSWYCDRAVCVADYSAKNAGNGAAAARLALVFANDQSKPVQLQEVKEGILAVQNGRVLALIDARKAAPLALKVEGTGAVLSGELAAGATARCSLLIPAWKVDAKDYAQLLDGAESTKRVESYWKGLLAPSMQVETPDVPLNDIIRASQVHCMMAARNEDRGERVSPWTASVIYGPLESESNAIIRGMDMNGQPDFARRGLECFLYGFNKGEFITTGYTLVGTGEVLWTLGEHYDRTGDREWLKKVAPEVVKICQWVIRQRAKTKQLDVRGQKVPEYGLMTPGVSADWNRFAYRFFNDAQFSAGLELAGRALKDIGDPAAAAIIEDAKQYREDIVRAYHWTQARSPVVKLDDGTWVPADPSLLDCLGRVEDFIPAEDVGRTWAYSIELGSHHLAAAGILDPKSEDAEWITDYLEDVQFFRTGMGDYPESLNLSDVFCFGGFGKVQPYYGRNAEIYAQRDDVKPYIRSYFNAIPTLVNAENLSFCEHFNNFGAWNKTHETGWFLCQTEIMLVQERGDELWLAPFATNHWTKDGLNISVDQAPTRFGKVGFTIESAVAKGQIEAVVHLPPKCAAKKIVIRLRHPDGKPMKSVTVQGKPHKDFDPQKETVTFAPDGETVTVQAQY